MLYNLPNGKTIYLTIEQYLNLTDEDIQLLIAQKAGYTLNPFYDSSLGDRSTREEDIDLDYIPDDIKEDDPYNNSDNEDYYEDDYDFLDPANI